MTVVTWARGSRALVVEPYFNTEEGGYLILEPGAIVRVDFAGDKGDQVGWLYGHKIDGAEAAGWFPSRAVAPLPETPKSNPGVPPAVDPLITSGRTKLHAATEPQHRSQSAPLPLDALPPPGFGPHSNAVLLQATQRGLEAAASLPMFHKIPDLLSLLHRHRVIVVDAATGSGKSTLIPLALAAQCAEANRSCRIVVTQPRRLAAKGLAKRVSRQCGLAVGQVVAGYRVGNDRQDNRAAIVYVTAGHLLQALIHNPSHLHSFSHIVLDEVHERSVEADFLAALMRLLLSRPETLGVRIVVMSATMQRELSTFFQPLLLPLPAETEPGHLKLPGATPFEVKSLHWEELRAQWPEVFSGGLKAISFDEVIPFRIRELPHRRRSDQLTRLCKDLAPFAARLLCQLRKDSFKRPGAPCISLVFLPGLDQMREVEDATFTEARRLGIAAPELFLMHSSLEESNYEKALEPANAGAWRIVLSTNIAESSLTVPGVDAVVDFGLHRVSVYDDESRMSTLVTDWCSRASMKQRRGRTGRTTNGWYLQLVSEKVLDDLRDFDESGVEKSPLTRIVLEAAHLAELLSANPAPRAGLLVEIVSAEFADKCGLDTGVVAHYDGGSSTWRIDPEPGSGGAPTFLPEAALQTLQVDARRVLGLLPTPPREDRVGSAVSELRELGALSFDQSPTALGTAYLKLPVDVALSRLVVLGSMLGCSTDAVILAAALSLAPSCDVFRTPFNMKSELSHDDLSSLIHSVHIRMSADRGNLSEPLVLHHLCMEWLKAGARKTRDDLGRKPTSGDWTNALNPRLWVQFTDKVIDLAQGLQRILPPGDPELPKVTILLDLARGRMPSKTLPEPWQAHRLMALLTWGLAPLGFVALGQTPALYGSAGGYSEFIKVVRANEGAAAGALWWPKMQAETATALAKVCKLTPHWVEAGKLDTILGYETRDETERRSPPSLGVLAQVLCRICGPFNGKDTTVYSGVRAIVARPPRHPCMVNWYMPRRDGGGVVEVRVSWKSQADTLIQVPRAGDKRAHCRPKHLLVASGGEYLSSGGRRSIVLRGATVLPSGDGGRSALLWLLASGQPREGAMVALVAPRTQLRGDFEVRAIRMWQRTLWLPKGEEITSVDLRGVNRFRESLVQLTRTRPHRLSGAWCEYVSHSNAIKRTSEYHITCLTPQPPLQSGSVQDSAPLQMNGRHEVTLEVSTFDGTHVRRVILHSGEQSKRWYTADGASWCEEDPEGVHLRWSNGTSWTRPGAMAAVDGDPPALAALDPVAVMAFRSAALSILASTADLECLTQGVDGQGLGDKRAWTDRGAPRCLARLVPLVTVAPKDFDEADARADAEPQTAVAIDLRGRPIGGDCMAPFDLTSVETVMERFAATLHDEIELDCSDSEDGADEEDEESDPDDDLPLSVSQEGVDEQYMWRLAQKYDWTLAECKLLTFVESSIALPRVAFCVDCEQSGKSFSKSQLARHPDERRCRDCVNKATMTVPSKKAPKGQTLSAIGSTPTERVTPQAVVITCCHCRTPLNKDNCSAAQGKKTASRRKCNDCVAATMVVATPVLASPGVDRSEVL